MAPVLSFPRTDRIDRSQKFEREGSPQSNGSSDSSTHITTRSRIATRLRRGSEPVADTTTTSDPRGPDQPPPQIENFCLGTPKKVSTSHSGAVELFISLQEKAVFLPTVKTRHQHRHQNHRNISRSGSNRNGNQNRTHGVDHRNTRNNSHRAIHNNSHDNSGASQSDSYLRYEPYISPPPEPSIDNGHASNVQSNENMHDFELENEHEHEHEHEREHVNGNADANANDELHHDNEHIHTEEDLPAFRPESTSYDPQPNMSSSRDADGVHTGPCSTLRGSVLLKLNKPTKIKEIGVNFYCVSRTLWNLLPQPTLFVDSALPNNAQVEDMAYLGIHRWDFVPLEQFGTAQPSYDRINVDQSSTLIGQDLYGADTAIFKDNPSEVQHRKYSRVYNSRICRMRGEEVNQVPVFGPLASQPRKLKQNNAQVDGVLFPAGSYVYNFTLLVDAKTPTSVSVPNGQVKFVLGAKVVRTGAFTLNVNGHMDVDVVRAPIEVSEASGAGPHNDAIFVSRVWEDSLVYSMNLERKNITLDVPTKLSLVLMPLSDPNIKVYQVQVFVSETVTYIYSLDQSIRYVDPNLKLLLYQKDAPRDTQSLLSPTDTTTLNTKITLVSEYNPSPKLFSPEPCHRGRYGELRFLEPDVKGPYIRVRHRLLVVLKISKPKAGSCNKRNHYEVKIDTPIGVLSRHCVNANISLPSYHAGMRDTIDASANNNTSSENDEFLESELPPSFDDAMEHQLLGPSGASQASPRGTKASFN